ncbi:hypothetical protein L484_014367 [Morus notabilis]|uniref:Ribonuclease H1 N-terminal domain-containing protein n=1 Tax=Morus notabilis TaxID=981085 RepID=W9RKX0_9ROSA|nr:hypothetical protein L484_014367 [Morus notabilis]
MFSVFFHNTSHLVHPDSLPQKKNFSFYTVYAGNFTGVFNQWNQAVRSITGYKGKPLWQGFETEEEAQLAYQKYELAEELIIKGREVPRDLSEPLQQYYSEEDKYLRISIESLPTEFTQEEEKFSRYINIIQAYNKYLIHQPVAEFPPFHGFRLSGSSISEVLGRPHRCTVEDSQLQSHRHRHSYGKMGKPVQIQTS